MVSYINISAKLIPLTANSIQNQLWNMQLSETETQELLLIFHPKTGQIPLVNSGDIPAFLYQLLCLSRVEKEKMGLN